MAAAIAWGYNNAMHNNTSSGDKTPSVPKPRPVLSYALASDETNADSDAVIAARRWALAGSVVKVGDALSRDLEAWITKNTTGWKVSAVIAYTRDGKSRQVNDGALPLECDAQNAGEAKTERAFYLSVPRIKHRIDVRTGGSDPPVLFSVRTEPSSEVAADGVGRRMMLTEWTFNQRIQGTIANNLFSDSGKAFENQLPNEPVPRPIFAALICSVNCISSGGVPMTIDKITSSPAKVTFSIYSDVIIKGTLWNGTQPRLYKGEITITKDANATIVLTEHQTQFSDSSILHAKQFNSPSDLLAWWANWWAKSRVTPVDTAATSTFTATLQRLADALGASDDSRSCNDKTRIMH
jgi:hypothetical protein